MITSENVQKNDGFDNLTKFIWVKKYTKTYKSKKIPRNIRKIRINTRENRTGTEKIHEDEGENPPKNFAQAGNCYIREPRPLLGLTRLAADKMLPGHGNIEDNGEIFAQPRAERDGRVANSPHTHSIDPTDRQTENCTQRRTTRDR